MIDELSSLSGEPALLDTAPLVISCEDESLWSIRGRLALPWQSAFIELLVYLGAARLQAPEPLDPWPGVAVETLLDEVWTPRARDPQNRESGQTWLRKSLKRLHEELATAAGGLSGEDRSWRAVASTQPNHHSVGHRSVSYRAGAGQGCAWR